MRRTGRTAAPFLFLSASKNTAQAPLCFCQRIRRADMHPHAIHAHPVSATRGDRTAPHQVEREGAVQGGRAAGPVGPLAKVGEGAQMADEHAVRIEPGDARVRRRPRHETGEFGRTAYDQNQRKAEQREKEARPPRFAGLP